MRFRAFRWQGRSWGRSALFAVALAGASFARPAAQAGTDAARPAARPRVGDKAPAFILKTVDAGEVRSLDGLAGPADVHPVVLVFVSCRCPYMAQSRQPLDELVKQYGGDLRFVGINANQNEPLDEIKADAATSFAFPVLRDDGAKVADLYGAERTPEAFLIDAKGIIRYHGGISDLGTALSDFKAGRALRKSEAKTFGCVIRRKP